MAKRYYLKDNDGNTIIPVSDVELFTDLMSTSQDEVDVYFSFYADQSGLTPQTPTAGTIEVRGEYEPGFWLTASTNPTVQASSVSSPLATYTPPTLDGNTLRVSTVLSGISGAAYFRAYAYKRGA